jgi:1-acyl-sn-glycerol-3-phosphate acyltransferase
MKTKRYTHWRHRLFLGIVQPLFGPFFKWYYRFNGKRISIKQGGPYLILSNHTSEFDIIFMGLTFDQPLYFVASDQLLNSGFGSWFLRTFFNPIPKSKSMADLAVVKRMVSVKEEGGSIAIYPEGNATMHGNAVSMPDGIGRLIQFLKLPVIFVNIHGLYLSSPRWSYYRKFGQATLVERTRLEPKDYELMSSDDLQILVKKHLDVSAYDYFNHVEFKGRKRAEGLHKLIFMCPQCQGAFTTYSKGRALRCRTCQLNAEYDTHGYIRIDQKRYSLPELDRLTINSFMTFLDNAPSLKLDYMGEVARWNGQSSRRTNFEKVHVTMTMHALTLKHGKDENVYTKDKIKSCAIQVRTKLIVYLDDGMTLLFRFPRHLSPYAMMMFIQYVMVTNGGQHNDETTRRTLKTVLGL